VPDASDLLAFALEVADEADAISLPAFLEGLAVEAKADGTPVTAADKGIEDLVRRRVHEAFPDHGFLGEEFGEESGSSDGAAGRWIVDPIDGTVNFTRRIPIWGTLLAFEADGALQAAVVSCPALQQRWWASRGFGAWTDQAGHAREIRVSSVSRLADAHVVHAGVAAMDRAGFGAGLAAVLRRSARDRGFGDALGYMLVAQGSADAMVETKVRVWDLAAPAMIVTEAGGRFTDLAGSPSYAGPTVAASNGAIHDDLLAVLRLESAEGAV
jgi:histidinol-phosphatase